jgi:hypothetical protein
VIATLDLTENSLTEEQRHRPHSHGRACLQAAVFQTVKET